MSDIDRAWVRYLQARYRVRADMRWQERCKALMWAAGWRRLYRKAVRDAL